jgi:hypothetical protein
MIRLAYTTLLCTLLSTHTSLQEHFRRSTGRAACKFPQVFKNFPKEISGSNCPESLPFTNGNIYQPSELIVISMTLKNPVIK